MRPISLSTFTNKVISRIVHERIVGLLPSIISPNQSGFVMGKNITENVLLAQEIIIDVHLRNKEINIVVKLDMAKAYDRVSWIFLTKVLRKFGSSEVIIDMVWRLVSANWYLVLVNGQSRGFFHSTRGLKQGDPLLPTLFVIVAEVLSKNLKSLNDKVEFKDFGMPKWSPKINHLSYVDDTILFGSGDKTSMKLMMRVLIDYERTSGKMINKDKSYFYLHEKTPLIAKVRIRNLTGIKPCSFFFNYLGCPIFYGRKKKSYFEGLPTR